MLAAALSLGVCLYQDFGVWQVSLPCPDTGPLSPLTHGHLLSDARASLFAVPTLRSRSADEAGYVVVTCTATEHGVIHGVDVRLNDRDVDFAFATRIPPGGFRPYDESGAWALIDAMASAQAHDRLEIRIEPNDPGNASVLVNVWLSGFRPAYERVRWSCSRLAGLGGSVRGKER